MTAKGFTDLYSGCYFYITIPKFGMADVHLPKQQKLGAVAIKPEEIVHIKDELF